MLDVVQQMSSHNNNSNSDSLRRMAGLGVTNFSIDEILRPEFGKRTIDQSRDALSSNVSILPNIVNYFGGTIPYCVSAGRDQRYSVKKCKLEPGEIIPSQYRNTSIARHRPTQVRTVSPGVNSSRPDNSPVRKQSPTIPETLSDAEKKSAWPAWVYCTRYSDRPSSGPRSRKHRRKNKLVDEKRPRTAFTSEQLQALKKEFNGCQYLTEARRQSLSNELQLNESQIKIWFQNKRAKLKKTTADKGELAKHLMAEGLYNHSNHSSKNLTN